MKKSDEQVFKLIEDANPSKDFSKAATDWSNEIESFMRGHFRKELGKNVKIAKEYETKDDRELKIPDNTGGYYSLFPDDVLDIENSKGQIEKIAIEIYGYHKDKFDKENENKVIRDLIKLKSLINASQIQQGHIILTHKFYDALKKSKGYINYLLFQENKSIEIHRYVITDMEIKIRGGLYKLASDKEEARKHKEFYSDSQRNNKEFGDISDHISDEENSHSEE